MAGVTIVGLNIRPADGCLHFGGMMRKTDFIHVRGPGEIREQDEKDKRLGNSSVHAGEFTQFLCCQASSYGFDLIAG